MKRTNTLHKYRTRGPKLTSRRSKPKKRGKIPSISKLIKQADSVASEIVRGLIQNPNGFATCYTCPRRLKRRKMDCGHMISRRYKAIRWHFDNMRIQCKGCNRFGNGKPEIFRRNLLQEIGTERVAWLDAHFDDSVKLTREFLEAKIKELKV